MGLPTGRQQVVDVLADMIRSVITWESQHARPTDGEIDDSPDSGDPDPLPGEPIEVDCPQDIGHSPKLTQEGENHGEFDDETNRR